MSKKNVLTPAVVGAVLATLATPAALSAQDTGSLQPAASAAAKQQLTKALNRARVHNKRVLALFVDDGVDLAKQLRADIITPAFKEYRDGQYKFIQFFAKKARGLMARYLIDQRVDRAEGLKDFDYEGYSFDASLSNEREWVFTRRQ